MVLFVFQYSPVCNFRKFDKFGFFSLGSERVKTVKNEKRGPNWIDCNPRKLGGKFKSEIVLGIHEYLKRSILPYKIDYQPQGR